MLVTELRISDLIAISPHGAATVYLAGTAQREAFAKAGHLLAMYENRTWQALKRGAHNGKVREVEVECIRCLAVGRLIEWFILATEGKRGYRRLKASQPAEQHPRLFKMAHACNGDAIAADMHEWIVRQIEQRWHGQAPPIPELARKEHSNGGIARSDD